MIESVLTRKQVSVKMKLTVKALISAGIVALAVLLAQLSGWGLFLLLVAVFQAVVPFTPALIAGQIAAGWPGLVLQLLAMPGMVMGLRYFLRDDTGLCPMEQAVAEATDPTDALRRIETRMAQLAKPM